MRDLNQKEVDLELEKLEKDTTQEVPMSSINSVIWVDQKVNNSENYYTQS